MNSILFLTAFVGVLAVSLAVPVEVVNVDPSTQDLQAEASEWVLPKEQIVQLVNVDDDNVQENEELDTAETAHHGGGGYGGFGGGYGGFGGGYGGYGGGYGGYGGGHHHGGYGGGYGGYGGYGGGHHHHHHHG